ncbi:MAG: hypothetical protein D6720_03905 [Gammaproteobacteria bacterium]|nr:MAG: hypothetical protein D6720_03905 [Gammaproteobacteria bacterium]
MSNVDSLAEQHIRRYESRLEHLDELIGKVRSRLEAHPQREQHEKALADILARRDELQVRVDDVKLNHPQNLTEELEEDGPIMGIADAIAAELDALLKKLGA